MISSPDSTSGSSLRRSLGTFREMKKSFSLIFSPMPRGWNRSPLRKLLTVIPACQPGVEKGRRLALSRQRGLRGEPFYAEKQMKVAENIFSFREDKFPWMLALPAPFW